MISKVVKDRNRKILEARSSLGNAARSGDKVRIQEARMELALCLALREVARALFSGWTLDALLEKVKEEFDE